MMIEDIYKQFEELHERTSNAAFYLRKDNIRYSIDQLESIKYHVDTIKRNLLEYSKEKESAKEE